MSTSATRIPDPARKTVAFRTTATDLSAARALRDAHLESAIPRQFLWALDALMMTAAFGLTLLLAPVLQALVAPGGALHVQWLNWLELPGGRMDSHPSLVDVITVLAITIPVTAVVIELLNGYQPVERLSRARLVAATVLGPVFGLSVLTLVSFGLRDAQDWSRVFLFSYLVVSIVLLAGWRLSLRTYKRRRLAAGRYARATAFIGRADDVRQLLATLRPEDRITRYRPVGFFSIEGPWRTSDAGVPDLGPVESVASVLVQTPIDVMVILLPEYKAPWLEGVMRACDYLRITVQVLPPTVLDMSSRLKDLRAESHAGPVPVPGVVFQPQGLDRGSLFVKRLIDVVIASALLVVLSPLFLLIAIAIKLTTPNEDVFYRWKVIGYKGRPFTGYKFTTMVADADARRAELMHLNEMSGPVFKIKDDPRITPLGRVLRKFSLNELPQLWSVVKGDMSLVGPRPAGSWEIGQYDDWHKRKLSVRPGMTCLWQVRGRNKITQFDDWVRMDLEYIDHWSLWLDCKILFRTAWVVVAGSGS